MSTNNMGSWPGVRRTAIRATVIIFIVALAAFATLALIAGLAVA